MLYSIPMSYTEAVFLKPQQEANIKELPAMSGSIQQYVFNWFKVGYAVFSIQCHV